MIVRDRDVNKSSTGSHHNLDLTTAPVSTAYLHGVATALGGQNGGGGKSSLKAGMLNASNIAAPSRIRFAVFISLSPEAADIGTRTAKQKNELIGGSEDHRC